MADAMQDMIAFRSIREAFAIDDTIAHRDYVRRQVVAKFYAPIILPDVRPARARSREVPVQQSLFDLCGDPKNIQPCAVETAKLASVEPPIPPEQSPLDRLVAAGITTPYRALRGALRDNDSPHSPRSLRFPVKLKAVGDGYELRLSTPACSELPFVRRIESISGLKARWVPSHCKGGSSLGQWHHAIDLATDEGWEQLASSMEHTTQKLVCKGVGFGIHYGYLSAENGRQLMSLLRIAEPKSRACQKLKFTPRGRLQLSLLGWNAIYAVEDGLIIPGNAKRGAFAEITAAGRLSVSSQSQASKPNPAKTTRLVPPSNQPTALHEDSEFDRQPTLKQIDLVEAAIRDSLPSDVPSFATQVISVEQCGERTAARLRLFDNQIGVLTFSEKSGAREYAWDALTYDDRCFHYDFDLGAWARIDELMP